MKLILFISFFLGVFPLCAQDFLGKSEREIKQVVGGVETEIREVGDTLSADCREEDERGRIFEVKYRFILKEEKCVYYWQIVALHEYWVKSLLELVEGQEGEEAGEAFVLCDERLYARYDFEDFHLQVIVRDKELWLKFEEDKSNESD